MDTRIVTIGAYGFDEDTFFDALLTAEVDTFCDIRQRRGMRGARYAFANSTRLQRRLSEFGIRYFHFKELAPSAAVREKQKQSDHANKTTKRHRRALSPAFVAAYEQEVLAAFDSAAFVAGLDSQAQVIALF